MTDADRIVVYGSRDTGSHTWTAREDQAVKTLARAIVFTVIDTLRGAGWESEFEETSIAPHDWKAIDDEVDRILLEHKPETPAAIEAAIAVLSPRANEQSA